MTFRLSSNILLCFYRPPPDLLPMMSYTAPRPSAGDAPTIFNDYGFQWANRSISACNGTATANRLVQALPFAENAAIVLGSLLLMVTSTFLVRQQLPIEDVRWMRAMIPHHSIAIVTSTQADLSDPEVKQLAQEIIEAQEREIEQMKSMIKRLEAE